MNSRFAALLIVVAGCTSATEPSSDAVRLRVGNTVVRLELSASHSEIRAGSPDTLRVRLTNEGRSSVVLHFNSSCQILPYISDADGTIVLPHSGGWGCLAVLTEIRLLPGQSVRNEFVWTGSTSFGSEMPLRPLPAGTYFASIVVPAEEGLLRTPSLPITLVSNAP